MSIHYRPMSSSPHQSRDAPDPGTAQVWRLKDARDPHSSAAIDLCLNTDRMSRFGAENLQFNMNSGVANMEGILQLPFTPSLTSSPSIGSSASSPALYPEYDLQVPSRMFPATFNASRRKSIDSVGSMPGSSWSTSPLLSERSSISRELPQRSPGVDSPTFHHFTPNLAPAVYIPDPFPPDSQSQIFYTTDQRPKKRAKRSSKLVREPVEPIIPAEPSSPPPIVAIPPAQASDLPFDPSRKPARRRGQGSSSKPSRSSKRQKPSGQPPSPQPMKFRFVSVQHSAHPSSAAAGSSTSVLDEEDGKVEFEEHMEEEVDDGPFEHGPSELPPRPYPGGEYATSPLQPKPMTGKIPASTLDFLPVLEARFTRLENAIERYIEYRAEQALRNSMLPGAQASRMSPAGAKGRHKGTPKPIAMNNQ